MGSSVAQVKTQLKFNIECSLTGKEIAHVLTLYVHENPGYDLGTLNFNTVRTLCRNALQLRGTRILEVKLNDKQTLLYWDIISALRGIVEVI